MPLIVNGRGVHVPAATRQCVHGDLTYEAGYVGVAIKQKGYTINDARSAIATIVVGEAFFLQTRDVVEATAIGGATFGQAVCIATATGVVSLGAAGAGQVALGRIAALPGQYGCPAGKMWINLDAKDSL